MVFSQSLKIPIILGPLEGPEIKTKGPIGPLRPLLGTPMLKKYPPKQWFSIYGHFLWNLVFTAIFCRQDLICNQQYSTETLLEPFKVLRLFVINDFSIANINSQFERLKVLERVCLNIGPLCTGLIEGVFVLKQIIGLKLKKQKYQGITVGYCKKSNLSFLKLRLLFF